MKTLVLGFGSIGRRHAQVLAELGHEPAVLSRRPVVGFPAFSDLRIALSEWRPEYVVICSRTNEHYEHLAALASLGFIGRVLVEKPLFGDLREPPTGRFSFIAVAYNLRFHPLLQHLREVIGGQRAISATVYVGQYLPDWRPQADYRKNYSAWRSQGGGVLRDLSHEIDYCGWLFGRWSSLTAIGGHFSDLPIETDDVFSLMLETPNCRSLTIHMNYLDRVARREIVVNTNKHTLRVDLIKGIFEVDGNEQLTFGGGPNHTYLAEHRAMLAGDSKVLCSVSEGLEVLETIVAAEKSTAGRVWISR